MCNVCRLSWPLAKSRRRNSCRRKISDNDLLLYRSARSLIDLNRKLIILTAYVVHYRENFYFTPLRLAEKSLFHHINDYQNDKRYRQLLQRCLRFTTLALSEFSQCHLNNVHDSDTPGYLLIPLRLTAGHPSRATTFYKLDCVSRQEINSVSELGGSHAVITCGCIMSNNHFDSTL